jgi:putative transposase
MEQVFGEITDKKMVLSELGSAATRCWNEIPGHFPHVRLDEFVIMPNHIHGIIEIIRYPDHFKPGNIDKKNAITGIDHGGIQNGGIQNGGIQNFKSHQKTDARDTSVHDGSPMLNIERVNRFQKIIPGSLGSIIRGFKIGVTKWCRENQYGHFKWQHNFHEKIINDPFHLANVRNYIMNNPHNWEHDELNQKK